MTCICGRFLCTHLHCEGVSATLLSCGIFPSLISPILSIHVLVVWQAIYILHLICIGLPLVMNYFELFETPVTLIMNQEALSTKFFALQRQYHPDFYFNASEQERAEVLEKSSSINKAYKIFQVPDETIKYVLQLKGLLTEEEKYALHPEFLMEMMELNEGLMDVEDSGFEETEVKLRQAENALYDHVKVIIEGYDDGVTTNEQLLLVKDYYYKKKYLQRILERMAGMRNIAGV